MSKKEERLMKLAQKGGNDATLLILDLLHELEDKIDSLAKEFVSVPIDTRIRHL